MGKTYNRNNVKGDHYIIKKKSLAEAIKFVTGINYYVLDCEEAKGRKVYSFEITPKFLSAFEKISDLKNQYNQMQ